MFTPILRVRETGDPILRQKAVEVPAAESRSRPIQDLIAMMRETMRYTPGVGLAAPQVGFPLQVVVIEDKEEYLRRYTLEEIKERGRKPIPFHVLVNPRVVAHAESRVAFFEGCLSIPGFQAVVSRYTTVRVEALNEFGQLRTIDADGWYARILQHEIDHVNGVLYIDHMESRSFTASQEFERYWKGKSTAEVCAALGMSLPREGGT